MTQPTILVVEDEVIIARHLRSRLQALGYSVPALVASGEEAISMAREIRPDLILMDIMLKGDMDGIEAVEHIRTLMDIPVVYLTAFGDEITLQRAGQTQPDGYILKPFKEKDLKTVIQAAFQSHQERRPKT